MIIVIELSRNMHNLPMAFGAFEMETDSSCPSASAASRPSLIWVSSALQSSILRTLFTMSSVVSSVDVCTTLSQMSLIPEPYRKVHTKLLGNFARRLGRFFLGARHSLVCLAFSEEELVRKSNQSSWHKEVNQKLMSMR